jgi:hypothetical protein
MIGNYWLTVLPSDYIWDLNGDGRTCILLIMANQYEFAILGQPVFQGYYMHHNMEDSSIGFTPLASSENPPLIRGEIPTKDIADVVIGDFLPWSLLLKIVYWTFVTLLYFSILASLGLMLES